MLFIKHPRGQTLWLLLHPWGQTLWLLLPPCGQTLREIAVDKLEYNGIINTKWDATNL